jgi:hypothetical protein
MEPIFAERFDPDRGPVGEIDEAAALARDRRGQRYVVCWPDRCLAVNRAGGTLVFHSLTNGQQRGYLAYKLARKTRRWRLSHLYVEGVDGAGMFVEVPLWEGRAEVTAAPFEVPSELDPPPEKLRKFEPPEFGDWSDVLSVPTDPAEWIEIPAGFAIAE